MIRKAVTGDEFQIASLGKDFFSEGGWMDITVWDHQKAETALLGMIENEDCLILVATENEVIIGMIGGFIADIWFSKEKLCQELFWYVHPDKRGRYGHKLLVAFEDQMKHMGANIICMIGLDKLKSLDGYFLKRGYRASEHSYIWRL